MTVIFPASACLPSHVRALFEYPILHSHITLPLSTMQLVLVMFLHGFEFLHLSWGMSPKFDVTDDPVKRVLVGSTDN